MTNTLPPPAIRKLLIANRGEIACRIIRTARRLGITTVAVYSQADRSALHSQLADIAIELQGVSAAQSYLDSTQLLQAAVETGVDAIHPGYGFLSENAQFAAAVHNAGLIFVGPSAAAITAMGSKSAAKQLMTVAGVPILPGYHGDNQDTHFLQQQVEHIGYPVLIKAVAGGGGRGLRVVNSASEFGAALQAVKREAMAAFADERVLLEKYLPRVRHIEIQIFADHHGHCVHMHERDCSIQRRHQKLIEEAPAPGLAPATRQAMGEAAIRAAQSIKYTGAGTVEFLYQDEQFYFLEMNTRLQVEHPVTEAIAGIDLVEWQLRIAQGETLPAEQAQIRREGWAMEARINAEGPAPDFLPSSGLIENLQWPTGNESIRVDAGFRAGDRVSVHYDSLLGKVIAWAPTRTQAAARLADALTDLQIEGIQHNACFIGAILRTPAFMAGDVHTAFLQQHQELIATGCDQCQRQAQAKNDQQRRHSSDAGNWGALSAWRNTGINQFCRHYHLQPLFNGGEPSAATRSDMLLSPQAVSRAERQLKAPLPGRIISILVSAGESVSKGQALLIMEAMKMEHTLRSGADTQVSVLHCEEEQMVQADQLLVEFGDESGEAST